MANYSFSPLQNIDTLNQHDGFYAFAFAVALFLVVYITTDDEPFSFNTLSRGIFISILLLIFPWYISYHTGNIVTYKNETVTGEFVGFVAEGYSVHQTSGKSTRWVDNHFTYVQYKIGDSRVLFKASSGIEYPKYAVIYKN